MKKFIGLFMIGMIVLTGCGKNGSSTSSKEKDTINIGMDMELSGPVSAYGIVQKNAVELAVEEINADGGILGKQVKLIAKDNKSESSEAASVASNLTTNDDVIALIGPATSGAVKAALPNATKAKVPLITPSGTDDGITVVNGKVQDYAFRTCFQDSSQGVILAKYATDNLDAQKVVVLADKSSDYAKGLTKSFKNTYKGDIVAEEYFTAGDTDFQAILTKIKKEDFDVIYLPAYYTEAGLIIKQAREMGIDAPIIGADGFGDSKMVETAGKNNVTNVYYTGHFSEKAPATDKVVPFVNAYKEKYGEDPNAFAALAYDSMYMIKAALEEGNEASTEALTKSLASLKDFEGVTGKISIDKNHNPEKTLVVLGLTDGKETSAEAVGP